MNIIFFGDAGDVTLRCIFFGQDIFAFLPREEGEQCRACNTYAYIQKIPYFRAFFDKDHLLSFSAQRKNIMFSGKNKYHLSRFYRKDHVQARISWKDHLSITPEENIIFPGIFRERSSFLLCRKNKIIFREKERSSFLIIQERSYSSAIFLERPSFQNIWKKNMVFRAVVCIAY